jgi:hypothetical protein
MNEQRAYRRVLLEIEASIADPLEDQWTPIKLLDISRMGIAFSNNMPMVKDSLCMLRFYLPQNLKRITCIVSIVHSSSIQTTEDFRVGAKFVNVNPDDLELIKGFIESLSSSRDVP